MKMDKAMYAYLARTHRPAFGGVRYIRRHATQADPKGTRRQRRAWARCLRVVERIEGPR